MRWTMPRLSGLISAPRLNIGTLGDVLGEIGTSLQLRQDKQNAINCGAGRRWRLGLDLIQTVRSTSDVSASINWSPRSRAAAQSPASRACVAPASASVHESKQLPTRRSTTEILRTALSITEEP